MVTDTTGEDISKTQLLIAFLMGGVATCLGLLFCKGMVVCGNKLGKQKTEQNFDAVGLKSPSHNLKSPNTIFSPSGHYPETPVRANV